MYVFLVSVDTSARFEGVSNFWDKDQSCIAISSIPPFWKGVLLEESKAYVCNKNNLDYREIHDLRLEEFDLDNSESKDEIPLPKKTRLNYYLTY